MRLRNASRTDYIIHLTTLQFTRNKRIASLTSTATRHCRLQYSNYREAMVAQYPITTGPPALPPEIWLLICERLPSRSLLNLCLTNRYYHELCRHSLYRLGTSMSQDYFCQCDERPTWGPSWCRCQDKCPALWAIRMIEPTTLSHFLSHGLSPNLECGPYFDEYRDDPWNLLTVAIFHRRDDMMRILLEAGADFRTPKVWPYQFSTPLHLAIQLPKYEPFTRVSFLKVVEVLLEHGVLYGTVGQDVNARVGWDEEQTAMMRLASTPQEDGAAIADLLLAHGA
jgi:hypothetical protein